METKALIKSNICINVNPEGCAKNVRKQISYVTENPRIKGPKRALIIGGSTGFGLASRIALGFGAGCDTISVAYEKEPTEKKSGSAGWYNTNTYEVHARRASLGAFSIHGDAFSNEMKDRICKLIKDELGSVDLVVYSIASGKRQDPFTGELYQAAIKPIGQSIDSRTLDLRDYCIREQSLDAASPEEIESTVKVMGGEDWKLWITRLSEEGLLSEGAITVAFSYIGPEYTHAIYREGTLGMAKKHLEKTQREIDVMLEAIGGRAFVSVNKALVTKSSAVIPIVPLYIAILYNVMKKKNLHEEAIHQMYRLFADRLYRNPVFFDGSLIPTDEEGRIRLDDYELDPAVQSEVRAIWENVTSENLIDAADVKGFLNEFVGLSGFDSYFGDEVYECRQEPVDVSAVAG
jgi:enoyl-[acyl-carrier protein] reductase/trans-2-enoyl-CoA reductase (NAD+)